MINQSIQRDEFIKEYLFKNKTGSSSDIHAYLVSLLQERGGGGLSRRYPCFL